MRIDGALPVGRQGAESAERSVRPGVNGADAFVRSEASLRARALPIRGRKKTQRSETKKVIQSTEQRLCSNGKPVEDQLREINGIVADSMGYIREGDYEKAEQLLETEALGLCSELPVAEKRHHTPPTFCAN